ncbi:unnamed protein product [Phaedon cochleariae]|uniref:protein-tyrosine-phosphatase n=1 Tax=Phaedon cochleariae TaxID=80249 RepID=A0A9N9SFZ6_PHACE|nr:unnamed protein product [Phaedon cochleariae]
MGTYIPPLEVTVGQRMEPRRTLLGFNLVPAPCTMQVIPIAEVFQNFFSMPGILKDILEHLDYLKHSTGDIENIMQGRVWRDIMAKEGDGDHLNLPLILFYDDFEVGNPLGSHATVHKLGGVYLSLPFLPGHYVSQLDNIFIIALFHASDRVDFGNNMVFQKVIEVLNNLRNNGINVTTDAYTGTIKFHVACITGDNLGLNGILGFVESFVANHFCRICSAHREETKYMLYEDKVLLRSPESYGRDVFLGNYSETGIKERCVFLNSLDGFQLFEHVSVDLLHDFLEGACRYVMSYVVQFLVQESKLVPLNIMQSKIASFNYGPDSGSKPTNCLIVDGSTLKLKTSAAEMMTLVRYFGILVGYYVPNDCEVWDLYIYLRRILDRLVNPRNSIGALDENIWRHFKIMKHGFILKVLRGNDDFLEFHDNESNPFIPKKMWLNSKVVDVLWKVHQYKYLYSDSKGTDQLGPSIQLQQNTLCISMFMALCDTCSLTLTIKNRNEILLRETFNTTNEVWKPIKVIYDNSKLKGEELFMYPTRIQNAPDTDQGMWALDDVRLCNKDEYRYLKSEERNTPCQTIAIQEETLLNTDGNDEIKTHGIKCPENSFGKRCIPCAIFGMDYCSDFEYCEYIDGHKECHCTPGFEESCSKECKPGTYGHGCQEICSPYCSDTRCRHIDGYCMKGCKYPFTGKNCEIPPEPFFVHQPIVSDITFSSTQVKMENFEVVGYDDRYPSYFFQYIEDPNQSPNEEQSSSKNDQNSWIRVGDEFTINETKFVLIKNLKPDTYYRVRAVMNINKNGRKLKEDKDFVKSTRWKTSCNEISDSDIKIEPHNITASVTVQIEAKNKGIDQYGKRSNGITVAIKAEAPQPPYQVHLSWKENNDLNISWYHPNVTNGLLKSFEVQLKPANQKEITSYYRLPSQENYKLVYFSMIEAASLEMCTKYKVAIRSHNEHFPSILTPSYDIITPPALPADIPKENIQYNSTNTTITIRIEFRVYEDRFHNENIYVIVSKYGETEDLLEFTKSLQDGREPVLQKSKVVLKSKGMDYPSIFVIGEQFMNSTSLSNPPLEPGTNYSVAFIFVNECYNVRRLKMIQEYMKTIGDEYKDDVRLWALILLMFIPLSAFGFWYIKHKPQYVETTVGQERDSHVYEEPLNVQIYEIPSRLNAVIPKESVPTYLKVLRTKYSKKIKLVDFVDYVKVAVDSMELENQHDLFPRGLFQKCERGSLTQNKSKNRYQNIIAYDHTRVELEEIPGDEYSDYINANYIDLEQLHFTSWPDHGVPLYPQTLAPFLQRMLRIPYNPPSPILVHCSAGVGRTGIIILCDICLRMAAGENAMDFLAYLEILQEQRPSMLENAEQYTFAHLVVLECLFSMRTAVPCSKDMEHLVDMVLQNNGVAQQMKYLEETQWQDSIMETIMKRGTNISIHAEKNRSQEIVPERYRVFLASYPANDPKSSYINAVLVDGFRNPGRYIVTQQPMPNTLGDFWRLVIERGCSVIINLNSVNPRDKSLCKFWPTEGDDMTPVDFLIIRHVTTKEFECYKIVTVLVEVDDSMEEFSVDIISMKGWKPGQLLPINMEEFLVFRDAADAISRNSKNVIVTCYDGATASGLYLAMSFLIERMKLEQECDVCLAVRSIRHSRKHFVTTEEQYEYLFRASLTFINGFQSYANFD